MDIKLNIPYTWLRMLKDYYLVHNPRLFYVVGLLFSRSLTNSIVINLLMWYFSDYEYDLVKSAILSNIHDSLSSLSVIFVAHAADSFVGRFRTILLSTTAYVGGLLLLWMFNPYDVIWLVVVILVLLALGTSGGNLLENVLIDLVHGIDKSREKTEDRSYARAKIWSRAAYVSGAVAATLLVAPSAVGGLLGPSWRGSFLVCMITMTATFMIFCIGHNHYHQGELTERPVEIFFRVCRAHIQNILKSNSRCLVNSSRHERSPENLETEAPENEGITQVRSPLRLEIIGKADRGNSSYKEDTVVLKRLFKMFPMWLTFLVVSLISATGSTFFIEQYSNLNASDKIPFQIYNVIQDLSGFAIPFLVQWICCYRLKEKVKIGVGMLCSIICCVFAWQLEVHRLKGVKRLLDQDANTSVSFLWLVPQFCLLGCMEGLTREGLLNFFKSQIEEPMKSYGEEYIEIVIGLGTLLNIFLILIFNKRQGGWFNDTINDSRLDKYYRVLICVCSVNFIIYCCVATCFYKDAKQDQESVDDDSH